MGANSGSWSVVATVRAPSTYVDEFLSHYLALGAERVFIFFDDPAQQAFDHSLGEGRVRPFICDNDYWANCGIARPDHLEGRQLPNFAYAAQLSASEWLLHVDNDELIISKWPIREILSEMDDRVFSLLLLPLEAVHASAPNEPFSTPYFKRRLPATAETQSLIKRIYGELAELSHSGFFGHTAGKSFIRRRYKAEKCNVHFATPADRRLVASVNEPRLELLHFDAVPFDQWRDKFVRRTSGAVVVAGMSKARRDQIERIRKTMDANGEAGLRRLYNAMHVLSPDSLQLALASGFVVERSLAGQSSSGLQG